LSQFSRTAALLLPVWLCAALLFGCTQKQTSSAATSTTARSLFEQTTREFHTPSAGATGTERDRLLNAAAKNYERLLKDFPDERDLCAQSLRALGSIHASQGKADEAVKAYAAVGAQYPERDWEVVQAWKAAGDLLWDATRREEAKKFYAQIVERFGKNDAPQIIQTVVRGSKARLVEKTRNRDDRPRTAPRATTAGQRVSSDCQHSGETFPKRIKGAHSSTFKIAGSP
jgi:tetratricopeptide (TPR) repeat protein